MEVLSAFVLGGIVRGAMVGGIVWIVAALFTGWQVAHPVWAIAFALLVGTSFSLFGMVIAIWSDKFEQLNLIPMFVITPLTFLGGVFYSAKMLPEPWATLTRLNPILYMVEGLRFGILGTTGANPWLGLTICAFAASLFVALVWWMLETGYKLRN
jgi:ABC-2 type transport system permease protein